MEVAPRRMKVDVYVYVYDAYNWKTDLLRRSNPAH